MMASVKYDTGHHIFVPSVIINPFSISFGSGKGGVGMGGGEFGVGLYGVG
jgi:hypothetical protein